MDPRFAGIGRATASLDSLQSLRHLIEQPMEARLFRGPAAGLAIAAMAS